MLTNRTRCAQRLSALASTTYERHGCPGAYVRLTTNGYELHEPSPNAFPTIFHTAAECEAAIGSIRHSAAIDQIRD
jgi:hypothetical protein